MDFSTLDCPACDNPGKLTMDINLETIYCASCRKMYSLWAAGDASPEWKQLSLAMKMAKDYADGKVRIDPIDEIKLEIPDLFKEQIKQLIKEIVEETLRTIMLDPLKELVKSGDVLLQASNNISITTCKPLELEPLDLTQYGLDDDDGWDPSTAGR